MNNVGIVLITTQAYCNLLMKQVQIFVIMVLFGNVVSA